MDVWLHLSLVGCDLINLQNTHTAANTLERKISWRWKHSNAPHAVRRKNQQSHHMGKRNKQKGDVVKLNFTTSLFSFYNSSAIICA